MNKREEKRLYKWCEKLYQDEAKNKYAYWLHQATELATQDNPDEDEYWSIKEQIAKAHTRWESCCAPCGYWPKNMHNDSFLISCELHKAWQKINRNKSNQLNTDNNERNKISVP